MLNNIEYNIYLYFQQNKDLKTLISNNKYGI